MAAAQNDVYMVCSDCACENSGITSALADGSLTRAELQRNAGNILSFIIGSNAMKRIMGTADNVEIINRPEGEEISDEPVTFYDLDEELTINVDGYVSQKGQNYVFAVKADKPGYFNVTVTASSTQSELAQIPVTLFLMGTASGTFTWSGTGGKPVAYSKEVPVFSRFTAGRLYFAQSGLDLISISFKRTKTVDNLDLAFTIEE
jgi:beta-glucosidase